MLLFQKNSQNKKFKKSRLNNENKNLLIGRVTKINKLFNVFNTSSHTLNNS